MAAKELSAIIQAHALARARGERTALATVVRTSGSTYRRAGARLWIGAHGETIGSISGGCLEDDARDRAQLVIAGGQPALIQYDTISDGDVLWGSGLGCQGIVHVLVEPLAAAGAPGALDALAHGLTERQTAVLATVFRVARTGRTAPGEFYWCAEGPDALQTRSGMADDAWEAMVRQEAWSTLRGGSSRVRICMVPGGGEAEVFFDVVRPPQSLLILGAGHDSVPLASLAKTLGWRVRVADRRRAYAVRERFPGVDEVFQAPAGAIGTSALPVEAGEAVVVMTHNYLQDLAILRAVLPTKAGYIGLLGPSRRKKLLLGDLAADPSGTADEPGCAGKDAADPVPAVPWLDEASLARVHGPAGLDIGAEAPEQIALSILAEIEAYVARRRGGSLKHRHLPLHDVVPTPIEEDKRREPGLADDTKEITNRATFARR